MHSLTGAANFFQNKIVRPAQFTLPALRATTSRPKSRRLRGGWPRNPPEGPLAASRLTLTPPAGVSPRGEAKTHFLKFIDKLSRAPAGARLFSCWVNLNASASGGCKRTGSAGRSAPPPLFPHVISEGCVSAKKAVAESLPQRALTPQKPVTTGFFGP